MNSAQGSDAYRTNDLAKTDNVRRQATVTKHLPPSHAGRPERGMEDGKMRQRRERIRGGTMTIVGWSDAAHGDQSAMGKRRLGYVFGLMSSTLRGRRRIFQWTSKFTCKLVTSSLGGEVYAFSEMAGHMSMIREFRAHFLDLSPGMAALEDCEGLFTCLAITNYRREVFGSAFPGHLAGP